MIIGAIILIMGILLVLQALGLISGNFWPLFWGILLVVLGLKLVTKRKNHCWHCEWTGFNKHNHGNHQVNQDEQN